MLLLGLLAFGAVVALSATGEAASIVGGSPITQVTVNTQLQCQSYYNGQGQFYAPTSNPASCGTFVYVTENDQLFGPGCPFCPFNANGYTTGTETGPSGSGTAADPWLIVTSVQMGGANGLAMVQRTTYINGEGFYATAIQITNNAATLKSGIIWLAGDCFLQGSDSGYGWVDPVNIGGIACTQNVDPSSGLVIEFMPETPGSEYYEAGFTEVWARINAFQPFDSTCECTQEPAQDNGAGISWTWSLQPGETVYFNSSTALSTTGTPPPPPPPPPPPIPPTASFLVFTNNPCGPPIVSVDATGSNGGSGAITNYAWDWGDTSTTSTASPTSSHTYAGQGTYAVRLTVTSTSGTHTVQFDVVVPATCVIPPPNQAPIVDATITAGSTCQDSLIRFRSTATDPEGQPMTYLWTFSDGGPSTASAQVDRLVAQIGDFTATFTATDSLGLSAQITRSFHSYGDPNCCPTIEPLLSIATVEGFAALHKIVIADYENDAVSAYVISGPPEATITPEGLFRWDTHEGDAGAYMITIRASDGCAVERTFELVVSPPPPPPTPPDHDLDGWPDITDNCPSVRNHLQDDDDNDGIGTACDLSDDNPAEVPTTPPVRGILAGPDTDGDATTDAFDTCPGLPNGDQADVDRDGLGDACDSDIDGDRIVQMAAAGLYLDNCPMVSNAGQQDEDSDAVGDACDADAIGRPTPVQGVANEAEAPARIDWGTTAAMVLGPLAMVAVVALAMLRGGRKPRI